MWVEQPTLEPWFLMEETSIIDNVLPRHTFGIPTDLLEDLGVWFHEFTEYAIAKLIGFRENPAIHFTISRGPTSATPAHIMVSLIYGCQLEDQRVNGKEYAEEMGI